MLYILIVLLAFFVACLTLQSKCWRFVWQLNGFRGLLQQPILWILLILYIKPNSLFTLTSRWRTFLRRPLAIIVGTRILLYVDDPSTMEQILNAHECLDKTFLQDGFFARKGLLHASGQQWRTRRKQLNPAFSHSILLSFFNIFNSVGNQLQYTFLEKMQGTKKATMSYKDAEDLLSRAVLEVSCLTMLGTKTNFTKNDAAGIASAYKELLEISALRIMKPWLQNDRLFRFFDRKNYERFMERNKLVEQFVENIVQRKHDFGQTTAAAAAAKSATIERSNDGDGSCSNDIDVVYNGISNETDDVKTTQKRIFIEQIFYLATLGELTLEDILNETQAMILVSFETVSNSLLIALLLLAMHPDCQLKLRNEINATYCKESKGSKVVLNEVDDEVNVAFNSTIIENLHNINVTQLQQMKYLDMIVNESLRLLTTVPINLRHVSCDFWLEHGLQNSHPAQQQQEPKRNIKNSVLVPRDTVIVVDTFNMQRDVNHWSPAAQQFQPEQHFATKSAAHTSRHSYAFIPFLKGLRSCIGSRYSLLLMKIFLVKLISSFEFRTLMHLEQLHFVQGISLKFQHADSISFQVRQLAAENY